MDRFDQRLQLLPPTILTAIAEIDELKGRWAGGASPLQIVQQTQVARPTVSQVISKLLDLQKIERLGQGRAVRYRLVR